MHEVHVIEELRLGRGGHESASHGGSGLARHGGRGLSQVWRGEAGLLAKPGFADEGET